MAWWHGTVVAMTPRLILRTYRRDDLSHFAALNADPAVYATLGGEPLTREHSDEIAAWAEGCFERDRLGLLAVERRRDGAFVGMCGLHHQASYPDEVEVAWRLAHEFWGHGYATEAAAEWLRYGFETLRVPRIISMTDDDNHRSLAVMQRLGMSFDHSAEIVDDGLPFDATVYAITAKQWRELQVEEHPTRWSEVSRSSDAATYAARFVELEAGGADVHGEARYCASLVQPGSRILDAGCGTGRVANKLQEWGYQCVGVDSDDAMLGEARKSGAGVEWIHSDLADLGPSTPSISRAFDLIVAAGNVVPLLAEDTEKEVIGRLAQLLRPGGFLVAGFGLHPTTLPLDWAPVELASYDRWCAQHELDLVTRLATWDGEAYLDQQYAVSVHRRR